MGNRGLSGKSDEISWGLSPSTEECKWVTENCQGNLMKWRGVYPPQPECINNFYVTENCLGNLMKWRGVGFIPLDLGV